MFFRCGTTNQSWRVAGLYYTIEPRSQNFSDAKVFILDICSKEDMRNVGRIVILIWMLWNNRNNVAGIMIEKRRRS